MIDHVIDYYHDGFAAIPFCKNCSAEGEKLHDPCKPLIYDNVIIFRDLTRTEFEERYEKALDQSKPNP